MRETTRIILLIVLIFLNIELLSAHQGNHNKRNAESLSSDVSFAKENTPLNEKIKDKNCEFDDVMDKCCCCINETCFRFENNCGSNKMMKNVSCKSHCEDSKSNANSLINKNIKTQNLYRIHFKINFTNTKDIICNSLQVHQKAIQQSIPTYISSHSFLI